MPVLLDDLNTFTPMTRTFTPKFFDRDVLTGSGKTTGLINQGLRPGRYATGQTKASMSLLKVDAKLRTSTTDVVTHFIPTSTMTQTSVQEIRDARLPMRMQVPAPEDRHELTGHATTLAYDAYLDMTPQGIVVTKESIPDTSAATGKRIVTTADVLYRMEVYVLPTGSTQDTVKLTDYPTNSMLTEGYVMVDWSFAPLDDVEELIETATRCVSPSGTGTYVNVDDLAEWMSDYDVYDRICGQAERWSSMGVAEDVTGYIEDLYVNGTPGDKLLNTLIAQLRYLETYSVPLEAYRAIHGAIQSTVPADIAVVLVKHNVNLLMNHTLQELENIRDQIPVPTDTTGGASLAAHFSTQQRTIITTSERLTLAEAGAGTGKSTTILARIKHLIEDCGITPEEITVLSFTNAAADNITEKNPTIGSMTIARMIHDIYSLNFPTHELSNIETIINSLASRYRNDPIAQTFQRRLENMDTRKRVTGATTALNTFVEHYRDQVIAMLDGIKQSCLELEIILAYQLIDTMAEPPHVSARYLIVDEVQDCSIFEFIYILKYAAKHHTNLFMVGK